MSDIPDISAQLSELRSVAFRIADERNEARAIARELVAVLEQSAKAFERYVELHRVKFTADGDQKAIVNQRLAAKCRAAIAKAEAAGVK